MNPGSELPGPTVPFSPGRELSHTPHQPQPQAETQQALRAVGPAAAGGSAADGDLGHLVNKGILAYKPSGP